jgi:hypothetical protein
MIYCKECGDIIHSTELKNHYEITLGNLSSGKFIGSKKLYYHKDCLIKLNEMRKVLVKTQIN